MKKLDSWLTVVMAVSVGLFLARLLYLLWDVNAHPALYAAQSAPWYVRLIVPGACMVLCLVFGGLGKHLIKKKLKKP